VKKPYDIKPRREWEEALLETGLFEWECKDGGKILLLSGTSYRPIVPTLWIKLGDGHSKDDPKFDIIHSFEKVLYDVPEDIQGKLLFHLDLMMLKDIK
jgi:hypothetical protein